MEEHQKKLSQGRPRKVRFKISSSYSGRVLKQVFEDGQELEPPAKERTRRFLRHSFEPADPLCGPGEMPESRLYSTAKLTAQRISIFKEDTKCSLSSHLPLLGDCQTSSSPCRASPILDFGKIIIYTNNLKIIRAPMDQRELMRRIIQTEGINDWAFVYREKKERFGGGHKKDVEKKSACNQYLQSRYTWQQPLEMQQEFWPLVDFLETKFVSEGFNVNVIHPTSWQAPKASESDSRTLGVKYVEKDLHKEGVAEHGCSQCKGSGSAPCSLCHGSKFSMLANRFRESYRALRCPACNESGLQPCQLCAA